MHKFQNFKCGCLKQRQPIHLSSLHASSNYREQHSLTHHFFLISRFLFLLTKKKRKNNFFLKSSNIQEGNLTMIKIFFKQYYSEIWEVVYTLVCVYVQVCMDEHARAHMKTLCLIFLRQRQGFSLNLEWGWWEILAVSCPHSPLPTAMELETYAVMLDFLHECWRFELKFSGLYSKWSFLLSHL